MRLEKMIMIWITGLQGAGKTTLAKYLHKNLKMNTKIIDGDEARRTFCSDLRFSIDDRNKSVRRITDYAFSIYKSGIVPIVACISPVAAIREEARLLVGSGNFIEIFVNTSLEVCEQRDSKGLYVKARAGELVNFTGIDSPYEPPKNPIITIDESSSFIGCVNYIENIIGGGV
jgi:adenylylsulfate kinase